MNEKTMLTYEDFLTIVDLIETFYAQGVDDASNHGGAYDFIRADILNQVYAKFDHPPLVKNIDEELPF